MGKKHDDHLLDALAWTLLAGGFILVLDAFVLGQGVLGALTALVGFFFWLPVGLYGHLKGRHAEARLDLMKAVVLMAAGATVRFANNLNNGMAARRAERIIAACEAHKRTEGAYPKDLRELVPGRLRAIPWSKAALMYNRFRYQEVGGRHSLSWVVFPPHGRKTYWFEGKSWSVGE